MSEKIKVLKNFSCNNVRKKIGDYLSDEDKKKIGKSFGEQLFKDDFLQRVGKENKQAESHQEAEKEDDLSSMDKEQLLAVAEEMSLEVDKRKGADKIREEIRENLKEE